MNPDPGTTIAATLAVLLPVAVVLAAPIVVVASLRRGTRIALHGVLGLGILVVGGFIAASVVGSTIGHAALVPV